jgi:two-component system chemotaxis sensor kinase CheA
VETIAECRDVLPTATIDALFRSVHTTRGEARAFDMRDLERNTEQLEEVLDELRADARGGGYPLTELLRRQLVEAFQTALAILHTERDLFAEASPVGRAIFTQTTVQMEDLSSLETYAARVGGELVALVERLRARPFGETAAGVLESAPSWASVEGKTVDVVVEHGDVTVAPALVPILPGILTHLVRNAIAHGIEVPEERLAAGKAAEGVIRVSAAKGGAGEACIVVEDDGRGLDAKALRLLAPDSATSVEELIFAAGISTRQEPDDLAGRGVGLDAVRTDLARIGYMISVKTVPGRLTRFTISDASAGFIAPLHEGQVL